jgi:hypothetical protein
MPSLPPIGLDSTVDPADQLSAIDFINRVNLLFDAGNIDAMVEAFLPDSVTYHSDGITRGQAETRRIFQEKCPYSVPGISRIATNPIVDRDGQGVIVRYHNLLVRYAPKPTELRVITAEVVDDPDDLPAIWIYSAMADRMRRVDSGWRIFERHIETTTVNDRLSPTPSAPGYMDPYLPRVAS